MGHQYKATDYQPERIASRESEVGEIYLEQTELHIRRLYGLHEEGNSMSYQLPRGF
jgi:hypothetical protein